MKKYLNFFVNAHITSSSSLSTELPRRNTYRIVLFNCNDEHVLRATPLVDKRDIIIICTIVSIQLISQNATLIVSDKFSTEFMLMSPASQVADATAGDVLLLKNATVLIECRPQSDEITKLVILASGCWLTTIKAMNNKRKVVDEKQLDPTSCNFFIGFGNNHISRTASSTQTGGSITLVKEIFFSKSVRNVLTRSFVDGEVISCVVGLVIYKGAAEAGGKRNAAVNLRDCECADYITVYMPSQNCNCFTVGMIVSLRGCRLQTSATKRFIYLTLKDSEASIGAACIFYT